MQLRLHHDLRLITVPADPLLESERDDSKRNLVVTLHAVGDSSLTIAVAASSFSKVRAIRVGRMFSLEISPENLICGDMVSLVSDGNQVNMVVESVSPLVKPV